ncbi:MULTISPECIES: alpha/beta hydrolase [Janthinobacterium]|uniref:Alpha/beta hydrolase n=1 Tax=Janthinobacterium kumbetense TaxID=2950280 RepID=A0ABT0WX48_9BURK|nr:MULTISPECIES: alpha/beta hydrolase [Janthinobacterium]MCM2568289.1 alpha/beta hydrolase [Janthinobacterium kumbetense]MCX7290594.1 alpha/beta hydrolase [Janthinobacterium sp.]
MSLDPQVAAFLALANDAPPPASLADLRAATETGLRQLHGPLEDVASIRDYVLPGEHALTVRAYVPAGADTGKPLPAIVFAHGGGWCLCSLDLYDNPCRALANATGCVIFSVDYRLAPEHKFPVPLNDFYSALCWVAQHGAALGIDVNRLAVGGDSAGGNLAAAAALMARDQAGPALAHQLLLYPALDFAFDTPSYQRYAEGHSLTREAMRFCWSAYLNEPADGAQPYAAPLRSTSLKDLPPATVLVCEYDPLHDEGEAYARYLRDDGVAAQCVQLDGMIHASMHMLGLTPAARGLFDVAGKAMRQALAA